MKNYYLNIVMTNVFNILFSITYIMNEKHDNYESTAYCSK